MLQVLETNLLNFRADTGKILASSKNPILIKKKGKSLGIVLPNNLADEFFKWQQEKELKEIYFKAKKSLKNLGLDFLKTKKITSQNLEKMSDLEIVNLID